MSDERMPIVVADERTTLVSFLDYLRGAVRRKALGVADEDARRPMVSSGTSLLGLVKHLAEVETYWFEVVFAGRDDRTSWDEVSDDDTVDAIVASYDAAVAESNSITATAASLDAPCARRHQDDELVTLRWVLVHMIEETGRHAGHADIVRELIDGSVGR